MTVRPIEEFLLLEPRTGGMPLDAQRLAVSAQGRIEEARAFMVATVAKEFAQKHRDRLNADLASRIEFLRQGFFYEQKELVEARSVWSKRRRDGHPLAEREIARIRDLQRAWESAFAGRGANGVARTGADWRRASGISGACAGASGGKRRREHAL